jgi:hypothetical protein
MAARVYIPSPGADIHIAEIQSQLRHWLAEAVAKDVRIFAAVDTGYMKTHVRVEEDGHRVHVLGAGIPPNVDVPAYVEYGTRPHDIPNAWGLGFTVHHPGTSAQPFMRPAAYRRRAIPPWVVNARASLAPR